VEVVDSTGAGDAFAGALAAAFARGEAVERRWKPVAAGPGPSGTVVRGRRRSTADPR
jgi:sugar/nucleoside kinase (ribokinase family)